jgi:2-hydroxy-6-oxonona-2,4-dienedioate hydrolase
MPTFPDIDRLKARAERIAVPFDGGALIARRWHARSRGTAQPVVLLHGGSGSWLHWIKTIEPVSKTRDVWCIDLPGLGESAMPPEPATPESAGRIVARAIDTLLPAAQPHLLGFSFGSHVGAYAATLLGQRLSSFILSGSAALGLNHPNFVFAKERHGQPDADQRAVHRHNLEVLMFADPRNIDDLAIEIQARNVRQARFKSRVFAATDDIPKLLPQLACPVGAMWGTLDNILEASSTPVADVFQIIETAYRRPIDTALVSAAGHWASYERPDAFNEALVEMLAGFES